VYAVIDLAILNTALSLFCSSGAGLLWISAGAPFGSLHNRAIFCRFSITPLGSNCAFLSNKFLRISVLLLVALGIIFQGG
jgi:hypothetical protein